MLQQTSRTLGSLGLAWILALGACGDGADSAASQAVTPATETPTTQPVPDAAPGPESAIAEPAADRPADATLGAESYAQLCATCHGAQGNADTPMADILDPRPARHSDGDYMNALDDAYLFDVIKLGGPAVGKSPQMAGWAGPLDDAQIRDVIAFVRTLADPRYNPPTD